MLAGYSYVGFPRDLLSRVSIIYPSVYLLYGLCSTFIRMSKGLIITLAVIFNLPLVAAIIYLEIEGETSTLLIVCYVLLSAVICGARVYAGNTTASVSVPSLENKPRP